MQYSQGSLFGEMCREFSHIRPLPRQKAPAIAIGTRVRILAPRDDEWRPTQDTGKFTGCIGEVVDSGTVWAKVRFEDGDEWPFDLFRIAIARTK